MEGGGFRPGKQIKEGEVDYKTKAGTAWSHSYLNQKPWHPLSYPNQRRKWIAEQSHAQRERRTEEVAKEYAQEQEFFRQTSLISKKEKEKAEMMQAVSFMYVRPPGYNPESAKAAEMEDEKKSMDQTTAEMDPSSDFTHSSTVGQRNQRPKDVFGRTLPTEQEFEILKNAPRMDTGVAARIKPFGVEIRNVKCLRCGGHGHQSGDRECPLKDAMMQNEESRLRRDDPLTAMVTVKTTDEPQKWELKQKPGLSPPRGGFGWDDPNQQIIAEDDIFDEYGGFLSGGAVPDLLIDFSGRKSTKQKSKKRLLSGSVSPSSSSSSEDDSRRKSGVSEKGRKKRKTKNKKSITKDGSDPYGDKEASNGEGRPAVTDRCRHSHSGLGVQGRHGHFNHDRYVGHHEHDHHRHHHRRRHHHARG